MQLKLCPQCNISKELTPDNFYMSSVGWCKECHKMHASRRGRIKEVRRRRHLNRYKVMKGCAHCGYNLNPVALDFHHLSSKADGVAGMLTSKRSRLFAEIRKCIVLCANCHRIEHQSDKVNL